MKKQIIKIATLGCLLTSSLFAEDSAFDNHSVGLNFGTLGAGIEYSTSLNDNFSLRTGFNAFSYSTDLTEGNIKYDADLDLRTLSLLLDYHPFGNGFRISGGAIYNGNELKMKGQMDNGSITINDTLYTSNEINSVDAKVDFQTFNPYLGIGYTSGKTKSKGGFVFNTELGIMYHGTPKTSLSVNHSASLSQSEINELNRNIDAEKKKLDDDISKYKFYPVASIGIGYRF